MENHQERSRVGTRRPDGHHGGGRILTIYLKPVLPAFAAKVEKFLAIAPLKWEHAQEAMEPRTIHNFEHLVPRLDPKAVQAMIEESREGEPKPWPGTQPAPAGAATAPGAAPAATGGHPAEEPLAAQINIDQFAAVDLRVAKVLTAEPVEKSDKLMRITLDVGQLGQRNVLAGIKKAYTPERLVGRLVVVCVEPGAADHGQIRRLQRNDLCGRPRRDRCVRPRPRRRCPARPTRALDFRHREEAINDRSDDIMVGERGEPW